MHCKLIVWFTNTFVEGMTDSVASPEKKYHKVFFIIPTKLLKSEF